MADKKKPADGERPTVEETVAEVVAARPVTRPRPKYCAKPNCGLRPAPGSKACAHHPRWSS